MPRQNEKITIGLAAKFNSYLLERRMHNEEIQKGVSLAMLGWRAHLGVGVAKRLPAGSHP
jgi:hypothetical protein